MSRTWTEEKNGILTCLSSLPSSFAALKYPLPHPARCVPYRWKPSILFPAPPLKTAHLALPSFSETQLPPLSSSWFVLAHPSRQAAVQPPLHYWSLLGLDREDKKWTLLFSKLLKVSQTHPKCHLGGEERRKERKTECQAGRQFLLLWF